MIKYILLILTLIASPAYASNQYQGIIQISLDGKFKTPIVEVVDIDDYDEREFNDGTCLVTTEASAKNMYKELKANPEFVSEYPNFRLRATCKRKIN